MSQINQGAQGATVIHSLTGIDIMFDDRAKQHIADKHLDIDSHNALIHKVLRDPLLVVPSQRVSHCQAYIDYGSHPVYPSRYITVIVDVDPTPAVVVTAYTHLRLKGWQQGGVLYERA